MSRYVPRPRKTLEERLMRRREIDANGCWLWTASVNKSGYGIIWQDYTMKLVHRVSLELVGRPIPDGLVTDHLCRVRRCFNPDHLEAVTRRENTMRSPIAVAAIHARKTHCVNDHPFSEENTYAWTDANGRTRRRCRTCMEATIRRRIAKRTGVSA
jgi:hypothetical protein